MWPHLGQGIENYFAKSNFQWKLGKDLTSFGLSILKANQYSFGLISFWSNLKPNIYIDLYMLKNLEMILYFRK